jgi:hypothetical protein
MVEPLNLGTARLLLSGGSTLTPTAEFERKCFPFFARLVRVPSDGVPYALFAYAGIL